MQVVVLKNNDQEINLAALLLEDGEAKTIVLALINLEKKDFVKINFKALQSISNARWSSRGILALPAFILLPEHQQQL